MLMAIGIMELLDRACLSHKLLCIEMGVILTDTVNTVRSTTYRASREELNRELLSGGRLQVDHLMLCLKFTSRIAL